MCRRFDADESVRMMGDASLAREVALVFVADARARGVVMSSAWGRGDVEGVRRQAHAIRGSASTMCAGPLVEAMRDLEEASRRPTVADGLDSLVATALAELEATATEIEAWASEDG